MVYILVFIVICGVLQEAQKAAVHVEEQLAASRNELIDVKKELQAVQKVTAQ